VEVFLQLEQAIDVSGARRPRLVTPVFLLITLSTFAYFVAIGSLIPTLPLFIEGPLSGSSISVGLVVGAFSLSAVVLRPFVGRLGDARGRRILIVGGAGVVALSIAAYSLATALPLLLLLRLVTGAGEAAFYVGAASAINDLAPDERRGEALSFFSLALYGGLALGPVLGEWVLHGSHFHTTWIVAAAAAGVAAAMGLRVPDTRPEPDPDAPPASHKLVHPKGLVPGTILATSVWGLSGFNTFVPLYALSIGMPGSRIAFVIFSGIVLAIRSFGARLPDVLGPRKAANAALIASTLGLATIGLSGNVPGLLIGAAFFGAGQALAFPALMTLALSGAPTSERGAVIGTFTAFFDLAFGLGALSLGAVVALFGYRGSFIGGALVAGFGIVLLRVYEYRSRRSAASARAGDREAAAEPA
jgi:MFS family permease